MIFDEKGQISFEVLLLAVLIITFTIFVIGLYMQTHDVTLAESIIRNEITKQGNTMERFEISTIQFLKGEDNNFYITTNPNSLSTNDFNIISIKNTVQDNTSLSNVNILINEPINN